MTLTVAALRALLAGAPDDALIGLALNGGGRLPVIGATVEARWFDLLTTVNLLMGQQPTAALECLTVHDDIEGAMHCTARLKGELVTPNTLTRAKKAAWRLGARTMQDIAWRTPEEIICAKNCGRTTLDFIIETLSIHGLRLATDLRTQGD